MKERPIIFSTNMVKAILDGIKTMTRRTRGLDFINKDPSQWRIDKIHNGNGVFARFINYKGSQALYTVKCPYGQVGDILIIKEAWAVDKLWDDKKPSEINRLASIWCPADGQAKPMWVGRTRSARFMCHWMSRARPEITEVRVAKLNDMTEADAFAEGCSPMTGRLIYRSTARYAFV